MTTALQDTFTDTTGVNLTAHTMNVGPGWTVYLGTFLIGTNNVVATSLSDDDRFVSDAGQADVTLTADCTCSYTNSGNAGTADIFFRVQDSHNGWLCQNFAPSNQFFLYELDSSSYNLRTSGSTPAQTSGVAATVGLTLTGTSIAATLNGTAVLSYTSSSFQTATKYGGRVSRNGSPPGTPSWDNFLVTYAGGGSTVTYDSVCPSEWQATRQRDSLKPMEFLATAQSDTRVPIQIIGTLQIDNATPADFLGSVQRDSPKVVDWTALVSVDKQTAADWLGIVQRDSVEPVEWNKSVQADAVEPADWTSSIAKNLVVPVEWSGGVGVTVDSLTSIEWGSSINRDAVAPMNWSAAILSDSAVKTDFNLGVIRDQQAALDWLRAVFGDSVAPGDTLVVFRGDRNIPIEFDGASAFVQGNHQIFRIDARGTVWLVEARGTVFKPTLQ